jgi:hypothetical protein
MDASEPAKPQAPSNRKGETREARLAKALRANLIRRKAQDTTLATKAPGDGRD